MDVNDKIRSFKPTYSTRDGILFVASFLKNDMYYNGDAMYHFLQEVYPLILEDLPTMPLTIVGRDIPQVLYDYVMNNIRLDRLVTFLESPKDISNLYDHTRLLVAPHLYGSGIQYKVRLFCLLSRPLYTYLIVTNPLTFFGFSICIIVGN